MQNAPDLATLTAPSTDASPRSSVDRLRQAGLKVTAARVAVLELLTTMPRPLRHGEIEIRLAQDALPRPDRVTLYRVLDALVAAGLVLKAFDAEGVWRFSAPPATAAHECHPHFRCEACGGMFCLEAPMPALPHLPEGFRLHKVELDLAGTCARCEVEEMRGGEGR